VSNPEARGLGVVVFAALGVVVLGAWVPAVVEGRLVELTELWRGQLMILDSITGVGRGSGGDLG
jgi:hypothetical protein